MGQVGAKTLMANIKNCILKLFRLQNECIQCNLMALPNKWPIGHLISQENASANLEIRILQNKIAFFWTILRNRKRLIGQ